MRRLAPLLLLAACFAPLQPAAAQGGGKMRVLGRASIEAAPDQVMVRVGVSTKASSPTAALDQNSAVARKLIDFAKQFGIDARDIRTDAVNLQPAYKMVRDPGGGSRQEPDGYTASNMVRVKLTDLSRLGVFMRQALDQGATNINGVQFGIVNIDKVTEEARRKAVDDAVRQAGQLADAARVKLGRILEITYPPRNTFQPASARVEVFAAAAAPESVPIEGGSLQVAAEVEITWALE